MASWRYSWLLTLLLSASVFAEQWQYEVTPYLWGAGLSGNTAAAGLSSPVDSDYSFFALDNLEAIASAVFSARNGRWRMAVDGLYLKFSDDLANQLLTTNVELSGGLLEATGGYQVRPDSPWEILAGARYVAMDVEVKLTPGPDARQDKSWLDPIVGVRFTHEFGEQWLGQVRADIGGFGVSSESATSLIGVLGYRFNDRATLKFGYRYLNMDFEQDRYVYDVSVKGLVIGLGVAF